MRAPTLSTVRFAVLVAIVLVLFVSGIVVGAAGAPLILGQANGAGGQTTQLSSSAGGATLKVKNPGGGRGIDVESTTGVPLKITAPAGKSPLTVNRGVKVKNLNADKLDGLHAGAFLRSTRVVSASVSGLNAGIVVLTDPRTGVQALTASAGGLTLKNTNAARDLYVSIVCAYNSNLTSFNLWLAPGETYESHCYAVWDTYFEATVLRQAATAEKSRIAHLSCAFADSSIDAEVVRSCVLVG